MVTAAASKEQRHIFGFLPLCFSRRGDPEYAFPHRFPETSVSPPWPRVGGTRRSTWCPGTACPHPLLLSAAPAPGFHRDTLCENSVCYPKPASQRFPHFALQWDHSPPPTPGHTRDRPNGRSTISPLSVTLENCSPPRVSACSWRLQGPWEIVTPCAVLGEGRPAVSLQLLSGLLPLLLSFPCGQFIQRKACQDTVSNWDAGDGGKLVKAPLFQGLLKNVSLPGIWHAFAKMYTTLSKKKKYFFISGKE